MGGPMYYARLINRNNMTGWGYMGNRDDVAASVVTPSPCISVPTFEVLCGEFRRMEEDQLRGVADYAAQAGVTEDQAAIILRAFMGIPEPGCDECSRYATREHGKLVQLGRCSKHAVYGVSPRMTGDVGT